MIYKGGYAFYGKINGKINGKIIGIIIVLNTVKIYALRDIIDAPILAGEPCRFYDPYRR